MTLHTAIVCATVMLTSFASFGDVSTQPENDFDATSVFGVCAKAPHDPDRLADVGVKWLRVDIDFTPTVSLDENLRWFDAFLRRAESRKMRVLPILNPRQFLFQYRPGGGVGTMQAMESLAMGSVTTQPVSSQPSLMDWGRWVNAVVSRYKGRVRCWEIANEPDLATSPQQYVAIAKVAYLMAKDADPACAVGAFSTAGINMGFIESCLKLRLAGYFDFVTVHPYQWSHHYDAMLMVAQLKSLRTLLKSYHVDVPIWMTEFGWPSHPQGGVTIERQAELLGQLFLTCAALERYKCFWYCSGDWPTVPTDQEGYFGLFYGDDRRKPSVEMLQTVARTLDGARGLGQRTRAGAADVFAWDYRLADGRRATAMWSASRTLKSYQVALPDAIDGRATVIRSGQPEEHATIANRRVAVTISPAPTLVVYSSTASAEPKPRPPIAATQPSAPTRVFVAASSVDRIAPGSEYVLPISIVNGHSESIVVTPSVTLPKGMSLVRAIEPVRLAARSETVASLDIRCSPTVKLGRQTARVGLDVADAIPVDLDVQPPITVTVEPIREISDDGKAPIRIDLTNTGRVALCGRLTVTLSGGTLTEDGPVDVTLSPGQSVRVNRVATLTREATRPVLRLAGAMNGVEMALSQNLQCTQIVRIAKPLAIDGALADWPHGIEYRLDAIDQVQPAKAWWSSADELSAAIRFAYDDENVYLAATVVDDVFFQPATDGATWLGDSIQWTIGDEYGEEFVIARTANGPELYRLHTAGAGKVGRVEGARLAVITEGQTTRYELALPWSAIPSVAHGPGRTLRINFIVNDNDGAGRLGYLEAAPGIGQGKTMESAPAWMLQP